MEEDFIVNLKKFWINSYNSNNTYKNLKCIIFILFTQYISKSLMKFVDENLLISSHYENLTNEEVLKYKDKILQEKGYFIVPSDLYNNVINRYNNKCVIEELIKSFENTVRTINKIEVKTIFTDMITDLKEIKNEVDFLEIVNIIGKLNYRLNEKNNYYKMAIDVIENYFMKIGNKYEMCFTPQQISNLLIKIALYNKRKVENIYDPCLGMGSFLNYAYSKIKDKNIIDGLYGEDISKDNICISLMLLIMNNVNINKLNLYINDSLIGKSVLNDKKFEIIISDPPYIQGWNFEEKEKYIENVKSYINNKNKYIVPSNKDMAFLVKMLSQLEDNGVMTVFVYEPLLLREGMDQKIREIFIDENYLDTIIKLPNNILYATSLSPCILVFKKNKNNDNVLIIDSSKEFSREGHKNKLLDKNIQIIVSLYGKRENLHLNNSKSVVVSVEKIKNNDYRLDPLQFFCEESQKENFNIINVNNKIEENIIEQNRIKQELKEFNIEEQRLINISYSKVKLSEICDIRLGKEIKSQDIKIEGKNPYIKDSIEDTRYTNKSNFEGESIILFRCSKNIERINYINKKIWASNNCFVIKVKDNNINCKYLYYYLKAQEDNIDTYKRYLNKEDLSEISIMFPSLENQKYIISILDKIYELEDDLKKCLNEESKLRAIQKEIYIKKMFNLGE